MYRRKTLYPAKKSMNLYYRPERAAKTAVMIFYVLFTLGCLLAAGKFLLYDIWAETAEAQQALATAQEELDGVLLELSDYEEIQAQYQHISLTDSERELVDRMEILALLDKAAGSMADLNSISISGGTVQLQFSGATLARTARIVQALEESPLVADVTVNTAATPENPIAKAGLPVRVSILINLQKEAAE